jgi:hypothetical protein
LSFGGKDSDLWCLSAGERVLAGVEGPGWGGGKGKGGLRGAAGLHPPKPQNRNFVNTDFVDAMISKVLRGLSLSRNQPVKSADDQFIRILKNRFIKLKKQEDRIL